MSAPTNKGIAVEFVFSWKLEGNTQIMIVLWRQSEMLKMNKRKAKHLEKYIVLARVQHI